MRASRTRTKGTLEQKLGTFGESLRPRARRRTNQAAGRRETRLVGEGRLATALLGPLHRGDAALLRRVALLAELPRGLGANWSCVEVRADITPLQAVLDCTPRNVDALPRLPVLHGGECAAAAGLNGVVPVFPVVVNPHPTLEVRVSEDLYEHRVHHAEVGMAGRYVLALQGVFSPKLQVLQILQHLLERQIGEAISQLSSAHQEFLGVAVCHGGSGHQSSFVGTRFRQERGSVLQAEVGW